MLADPMAQMIDICGESVTFKHGTGISRSIKAYVQRDVIDSLGNVDAGAPKLTVWVANNSGYGIKRSELDTGGDRLSLPTKVGGTAADRPISALLAEDSACLRLEVR
jgi:hypothetical protein